MTHNKHDEICRRAAAACARMTPNAVAGAFVASLGSRDLVGRSALGSFAVLRHFSPHLFDLSPEFAGHCRVCGLAATDPRDDSDCGTDTEAALAARRRKYPFQVRHTDLAYAAHDLAVFAEKPRRLPSSADATLLQGIVAAIRALPSEAGLTDLNRCLVGRLASNKYERQILLEQWGYCGILCPASEESYQDRFIPYETRERRQPSHYSRREWEYPVRFWTGADGINDAALEMWFGEWR